MSATPPRVRERLFARDGWSCMACGTRYQLSPQHRANRGMGGAKDAHRLSGLITLCVPHNDRLESDAAFAEHGRQRGWKVKRNSGPPASEIAVWSVPEQGWFLLADDGSRLRLPDSPTADRWLPAEWHEYTNNEGP